LLLASPLPAGDASVLRYDVEWRLIKAAEVRVRYDGASVARVQVQSVGLVSKLYRVNDNYMAVLGEGFCTSTISGQYEEGSRRRETLVTFDAANKRSSYLEKDLVKNSIVLQKEMALEGCVHDVVGGLMRLRRMKLEPGKSFTLPLSDGKKIANAKIEVEARETIKTPAGSFAAFRTRIEIFDGVLYNRKGALHVWISDDQRQLPVQMRARFPFYVGTITFQLVEDARP
jgi:hypothetical protein